MEANNKCMKNHDKKKELSYLKYLVVKYLYGWAMSQRLSLGGFKWVKETSKFNEDFIKSCNEDGDVGYSIEVNAQYPKELHELYHDLPFLPERMKIEKVEKLAANLHDKRICNTHKKFKTSIKSCISIEKSAKSH